MTDTSTTLKPESPEQVLEALKWASGEGVSLNVQGCGSKQALGRVSEGEKTLDLSSLSGMIEYSPGELVLTAKAATPMAEIEKAVAEQGQQLNFEPPDFGPLLGLEAGQGSIGGMIACNLAGARRIKTGAARDHFLGFHGISGRGEVFKSGGKVVKNVTGFDLSKLIAGSYGTLAVMTEATLKVLPAPEKTRTVLVHWATDGVYDHAGMHSMTDALGSSHEVSAAAYIPAKLTNRSKVEYIRSAERSVTAIRVEGPGPSVEHRTNELKSMLGKYGEIEELHSKNSMSLWKEIGDVSYFAEDQGRVIWRLSVPPAEGSKVAMAILEDQSAEVFYDWGGGLIWLSAERRNNAGVAIIRATVEQVGGHATLFRGPDAFRKRLPVFHPQPEALAGITRRVKDGFDPNGILNPGRMYDGV